MGKSAGPQPLEEGASEKNAANTREQERALMQIDAGTKAGSD
jgi:hypothetical protein